MKYQKNNHLHFVIVVVVNSSKDLQKQLSQITTYNKNLITKKQKTKTNKNKKGKKIIDISVCEQKGHKKGV